MSLPHTRGAEHSRAPEAILAEARVLVAGGARELVLLGQNVNAYAGPAANGAAWSLARLCEKLAGIEGLARIRYTTSHPRDMSDDLIAAHRDNPKLMPFLHLPVQSGSDSVLAAMNRRHGAEDYLSLIERIRAARPDIALSSDFIVGYPGESDADFEATLALVREVGFAQTFSFKYSKRPGTPAAGTPKQISETVKSERLGCSAETAAGTAGRIQRRRHRPTMEVLVRKAGPHRQPGHWPHAVSASGACRKR